MKVPGANRPKICFAVGSSHKPPQLFGAHLHVGEILLGEAHLFNR
jgi:hypothetical protein